MKLTRLLVTLIASVALTACQLAPSSRPDTGVAGTPSRASESLRNYYTALQSDLLTRGLLRTDGGGPDTPFSPEMLARNFERIAFYDEYTRGAGLQRSGASSGGLRRWSGPVRINAEFGASVPDAMRSQDTADIRAYATRLGNVTGHAISYTSNRPNFHVLVMGKDDEAQLLERVRQIIPGVDARVLNLFSNVPRPIHCLVMAFSASDNDYDYRTAIAYVRAEHPDLMRKSCYHEEMAQGLGLANDSPDARPSIFNDDDEFALLTTHDEALLSMLYDPRMSIAMPIDQARPILHILAREKAGRLY